MKHQETIPGCETEASGTSWRNVGLFCRPQRRLSRFNGNHTFASAMPLKAEVASNRLIGGKSFPEVLQVPLGPPQTGNWLAQHRARHTAAALGCTICPNQKSRKVNCSSPCNAAGASMTCCDGVKHRTRDAVRRRRAWQQHPRP
jgi:hypothetical protein